MGFTGGVHCPGFDHAAYSDLSRSNNSVTFVLLENCEHFKKLFLKF